MKKDTSKIVQIMLQLINDHFWVQELKNHLSDFVSFKMEGNFPFGQLVCLHYQMFGGQSNDIYQAAAAVELMILSLDIFDDLQDHDDFSVPWNKMDVAIAMNIATGLLVLSTKALEQTSFELTNKLCAIRYLSTHVLKAVNGQHNDLMDSIESEEDYIRVVRNKSAALLASACLIGTALATEKYHDIVNNYAVHMGIAAQIKNDIKDICRLDAKNDLVNKKKTLPALYLLHNSQPELQFIKDYYSGKLKKEELCIRKHELQELVKRSGALEYAAIILRINQLQAIEQIKEMRVAQEWKEKLLQFV